MRTNLYAAVNEKFVVLYSNDILLTQNIKKGGYFECQLTHILYIVFMNHQNQSRLLYKYLLEGVPKVDV